MKREINRKIQSMCDAMGTAAAAEMAPELIQEVDHVFDQQIAAGMSELEAYRAILSDLDRIQAELDKLPVTESEAKSRIAKLPSERLKSWLNKASPAIWFAALVMSAVRLFSGHFLSFWTPFLGAINGQRLFDMLVQINRGMPERKALRKYGSGFIWIGFAQLAVNLLASDINKVMLLPLIGLAVVAQVLLSRFTKDDPSDKNE